FDGTGGRSDRALDPTTFACGHRCSLARSTRNSLCRSFDAGVHLGECDRPAHDPPRVRRALANRCVVAFDARSDVALDPLDGHRAGGDGLRAPSQRARRLDRRRHTSRHHRHQTVRHRSVANRRCRAHRLVHRRGCVVAGDRLRCTGSANSQRGSTMIRAFILAAWAAALPVAVNAESLSDFAYRIPLTTEGNAAFYRVELPAAVYEGALRGDLSDLRVFNRDGATVAFAFLPRPPSTREAGAMFDLPLFPLRADSGREDLGDLAINVRR